MRLSYNVVWLELAGPVCPAAAFDLAVVRARHRRTSCTGFGVEDSPRRNMGMAAKSKAAKTPAAPAPAAKATKAAAPAAKSTKAKTGAAKPAAKSAKGKTTGKK
jgi:hypothetical protein